MDARSDQHVLLVGVAAGSFGPLGTELEKRASVRVEVVAELGVVVLGPAPAAGCLAVVDTSSSPHLTVEAVCSALRAWSSDIGILIVGTESLEARLRAFAAGADDCVGSECDVRELVARSEALVRRVQLRNVTSSSLGPGLPSDVQARLELMVRTYGLSRRERQILELMVRGQHPKAMSQSLGCAYSSIRTYSRRMCLKVGCSGSRELLVRVFTHGDAGYRASNGAGIRHG